jgi:NodT family efflux transporter outer membrane factor (OMF) lipoprotein
VLTDLIESALAASPTLQKAEARLKAAGQRAYQKRAALFPEIDFDGNDNWQHLAKTGFFRAFAPTIPALVNDITLGLSFSYEFDFWGKNRALFQAAVGMREAMRAEKQQAELILTTSIAYTYLELQFLLKKKELLAQVAELTGEIEAIVRRRMEVGIDAKTPKLASEVSTLDIERAVVALEAQIELDRHRLKALSGMGQESEVDLGVRPFIPWVVKLPQNLALDLIARRPDLAAQKRRCEALSHEIHAAKTDFYPNVNLMGLVGFESVFASKLFRSENYSGTATPAVHLPIFTAGRLRGQLKEKVAQFNEAVFGYNELILQVANEVADRLTALLLLQKEIDLAQSSLAASEKKEWVSEQRLENALDDKRVMLQEKNLVLGSEMALLELEFGKQLEAILLIRSLGGGFHEGT